MPPPIGIAYAVLLFSVISTGVSSPISYSSRSGPPRFVSLEVNKRSTVESLSEQNISPSDRLAAFESSILKTYGKYGLEYPSLDKRATGLPLVDDLVMATSPCLDGCPYGVPLYNPTSSNTSQLSATDFIIQYGTGGAEGVLATDRAVIGPYSVPDLVFAAATNLTNIVDGDISGLLGLGWTALAAPGTVPLLQRLWEEGKLEQPMFGFAFARWAGYRSTASTVRPGGYFTMGGVNTSLISGEINYISAPSKTYWEIPMEDITVGGVSTGLTSPATIIDTGTSLIGVPDSAASMLYSQIPGSGRLSQAYWGFPCSYTVDIAFVFGGVSYAMSSEDFNSGVATSSGTTCLGSVFSLIVSDGVDRWIFGDAFLKNVYSVYRFDPPAVGFALLSGQSLTDGPILRSNATTTSSGSTGSSGSGGSTGSGSGVGPISSGGRRFGSSTIAGVAVAMALCILV